MPNGSISDGAIPLKGLTMSKEYDIKEISPNLHELSKSGEMRVPGKIYGDSETIRSLQQDVAEGKEWNALKQVANVACLPGIVNASLAMADIHPGYGFCIGGVGAFDTNEGVISVAGVGFDINCGVRTLRTTLTVEEIEAKKDDLARALYRTVPAGLGSKGDIRLSMTEIDEVLIKGALFSVERGYGTAEDLQFIENGGRMTDADPVNVSVKAKERQKSQIGTLGSGNHYLEVQYVDELYDQAGADAFGLFRGQIVISIHSGSRALGHQIGTDYLQVLERASKKYGIPIREKELVCAPIKSEEGKRYFAAMNAGANCAFANRQAMAHLARKSFQEVLGIAPGEIETLYEVAHNMAKLETHEIDGKKVELLVHRKGSTRAFGPGRKELPAEYREVGQPVLVGGTMGTASYILRGTTRGMEDAFGSAIHGAGRHMSRRQAKKQYRGDKLIRELAHRGILIMAHSKAGVAEEAPGAYKDVSNVVEIMDQAGINRKVARLRPMICIKG
jgi:tRNA-splicing ligase RtcB